MLNPRGGSGARLQNQGKSRFPSSTTFFAAIHLTKKLYLMTICARFLYILEAISFWKMYNRLCPAEYSSQMLKQNYQHTKIRLAPDTDEVNK